MLEIINRLYGLESRNVKKGLGCFITMEFGENIIEKYKNGEKCFGEWYLWLYMCAWRVDKNNEAYIGCEDDQELISERIKIIEGKKILKIEILNKSYDTLFYFSDDIVIRTFADMIIDSEQWMLFTPGNKVLKFEVGKEIIYEDAK